MSRTLKRKPPNPYRKEDSGARRATNREVRHDAKAALRREDEVLPLAPRTEGYLTW